MKMAKDSHFGKEEKEKRAGMSQEFDFSEFYETENSVDITNYMTSANLELCDDELFQSLFPTSPDNPVLKSEKPNPYEHELDPWNEPGSACSSACSSRVQSPIHFVNPHPVLPQPDRTGLTEMGHFQTEKLTPFNLTSTQLTPLTVNQANEETAPLVAKTKEKISPKIKVHIKHDPDAPQPMQYFKEEPDKNNNEKSKPILPNLVKIPPKNFVLSQYITFGNEVEGYGGQKRPQDDNEGTTPSKKGRFKVDSVSKESEEYKQKRERNNIAVRKSREKAKIKSIETQTKVEQLSDENKRLRERVSELVHELNTLKGVLKSFPRFQQEGQYRSHDEESLKSNFYNKTNNS